MVILDILHTTGAACMISLFSSCTLIQSKVPLLGKTDYIIVINPAIAILYS